MVQGVSFDLFGVLVTDGWHPLCAQYFGGDSAKLIEAQSLNNQANSGLINYQQFLEGVGELARISAQEVEKWLSSRVANEPLLAYIAELKPKYKIGLLSNSADNWLAETFTPEQLALFDATVLSYQHGFIKPQAEAYEFTAHQLGVPIEACVHIDDQERHCTGARDAGMQAIWYQNFEQMKAELDTLLADSKS